MNKPFLTVETISRAFVTAYPVVIILYDVWMGLARSVVYWEGIHTFTNRILCLQGVGFFIFLICLLLANLRAVQSLIVSVLVVCLLCFTSAFWFLIPDYAVEDIEKLNQHTYILVTEEGNDYGYDWTLLDCFPVRFLCKRIPLAEETGDVRLVRDTANGEIHAVKETPSQEIIPLYTAGSPNRSYLVMDGGRLGSFSYHISKRKWGGNVFYGLYRCDPQFTCMKMPFQLTLSREEDKLTRGFHLKTEEASGEILIYRKVAADEYADHGSSVKVFTFDGTPHCHVIGCSITGK